MLQWKPQGQVTIDQEDEVWLVTLVGEFDLSNVEPLRETMESLLAQGSRPMLVVIDLCEVTFLDSSVLAALLHAHKLAADDPDVRIAVVVDSPEALPARLLRLVGVTRRLPTFADRALAIASLTG